MRSQWLFFAMVFAGVGAGCSRSYYRNSADQETYPIIAERVVDPTYSVGRIQLEPAHESRLADFNNPDKPPKPPDDPAAALFMENPGGIRGSSHWKENGEIDSIEPAGWEQTLGLDEKGTLKLTQDKATELALLNSREYQTELEDVYLSALGLTLNRFEFDLRWFGRSENNFVHAGASSLPTESNTLSRTSNYGFNRNFATGGQLLVDFANSFMWEFTGKTNQMNASIATTFVQPLLRNFGRQVRLESLTQAERDVLYSVRDFARFRKQFWTSIAISNGGYLDLLLQTQTIRNARLNLRNQEQNYRLNQELYRGNKKSVVEVDQAFQGLLGARQQILDTEIGLQNSLDVFKLKLGLPPRLPIELDETPLEKFVLNDRDMEKLRDDLDLFDRDRKKELDNVPSAKLLRSNFEALEAFAKRVTVAIDVAELELKEWKKRIDRPSQSDDDIESRERILETYKQLENVPAESRTDLKTLVGRMIKDKLAVAEDNRTQSWEALTNDVKKLTSIFDDVFSIQTLSRIYRIELPAVDRVETEAIEYAKAHRLDLQNQQARVTDAWRKVTVAANALKGDVNLVLDANIATSPDAKNPFDFSNDFSRYRVGLQIDSPLNRQAERNVYRASQITYQRSRRAYMQLSDTIEQQIRGDLRSLRQSRTSFEIARQKLIAAARQVENERILLSAPVQPKGSNGGDATLRTLQALAQLNDARNALAVTFIRYEQQRIQFLLNLEEMQLDDRGLPTNATPK